MLDYTIQEKRRDLSRSSYIWLWKNRNRNELRNKYPTLSYIPRGVQQGLHMGYTNRMSVALSSSLYCWNFPDFDVRDKARNAFLTEDFSPRMRQIYNLILNLELWMLNYFCIVCFLSKTMQTLRDIRFSKDKVIRFCEYKTVKRLCKTKNDNIWRRLILPSRIFIFLGWQGVFNSLFTLCQGKNINCFLINISLK